MKNYDEIIGFNYVDENEWINWIREKLLPLYKQLSIILKLREYLENILKTNLREALSKQSIKEILLGGVTEEGEYSANSLAKLYKDALGISINPKEWIAYCKAGLDPAENGIKCMFEDTFFLAFVSEIKKLVERILFRVGIEPQTIEDREIEEIVDFPEKLLEIIRELYKSIVSISANYDYHMFFILNTRCIPRFFIEKAYPKLKENFEKVSKILELEEKFVPNVSDEKIRINYTLIGHKENGLASILFELNEKIWEKIPRVRIFENVGIVLRDLKTEYYNNAKQALEKIGWEKPKYIWISDPPGTEHVKGKSGPWYYAYYIEGIVINQCREKGWSKLGYYHEHTWKCSFSFIQLMHDISPALFLNIYYLIVGQDWTGKNWIEIVKGD